MNLKINARQRLYFKLHPRLPHFEYNVLATDRLTQLFATWRSAVERVHSLAPRPSTIAALHDFCQQVDKLHRRRFLKAFAKARQPTKRVFDPWRFGMSWELVNIRPYEKREQLTKYRHNRFWCQHIPKLP